LPAVAAGTGGAVRTVCTATVNSSDEARVLSERLPPQRFQVVELVRSRVIPDAAPAAAVQDPRSFASSPGPTDWLGEACRSGVRCDALVISGHFNAGDAFYAADVDRPERLDVDALERASCSESCPALFSRLRAVYLLGCESLNPDRSKFASADGDSGLDRMRRLFAGVASIYGFSGPAPAGPLAASTLERYFEAGGGARFGEGSRDAPLLRAFSALGMVRTSGLPRGSEERALACRFFDERTTPARKLEFVHDLLREDGARHRRRIVRFLDGLAPAERAEPGFARAAARLRDDASTRSRFLAQADATPAPAERARRLELAQKLGWLPGPARAAAVISFARDMASRPGAGADEVDLACSLARDDVFETGSLSPGEGAARTAIRACLGDEAARRRTLLLLASAREDEAGIARAYLRHHPDLDAAEVRALARSVACMAPGRAKVRALEALARLPVEDREALAVLERLFAVTRSAEVQEAVAEIFLRSPYRPAGLASLLEEHRLAAPGRGPLVDSLAGFLARAS